MPVRSWPPCLPPSHRETTLMDVPSWNALNSVHLKLRVRRALKRVKCVRGYRGKSWRYWFAALVRNSKAGL